jgi:SAM-dependent methyltransferase
LDFGAGRGTLTDLIRQRGYHIHCVEPDAHLREALEKKTYPVYTNLEQASQFDSVYSINVLEHIKDDASVAEQLVDHLNPGGRLVIYVPAFSMIYSSLDQKIGHQRRYTKESLIKLFPQMKILECRYVDSLGFLASLYLKYIGLKYFGAKDGSLSPQLVRFYDQRLFPLSLKLDLVCQSYFGKNVFMVAQKR